MHTLHTTLNFLSYSDLTYSSHYNHILYALHTRYDCSEIVQFCFIAGDG